MHRVPLPLPTDGLRAVNVYVIEDDGGLVLIDSAVADLAAALLAVDARTAAATKELLAGAVANTLEQQAAAERQAQAALLRSRLTAS